MEQWTSNPDTVADKANAELYAFTFYDLNNVLTSAVDIRFD